MAYAARFLFATSWRERLSGLLDKRRCRQGEVLVLMPCSGIHTFGMREAIDVAFVSSQGTVLSVARGLLPRRFLSCRRAVATLERRSDPAADWYEVGEQLCLDSGVRPTHVCACMHECEAKGV